MKTLSILLLLLAVASPAQVNRGELQLKITDPSGAALRAAFKLESTGNVYKRSFSTDASGKIAIQLIPFGTYDLEIAQAGFAPFRERLEIRSSLPLEKTIRLHLAAVNTLVKVTGADTLIDPDSSSSVMQIGPGQIAERLSSLPGRSVQDLVNSQPGWLYEGDAVLHPRGSEYQTQLVLDGIPLTDDRSPGFGPEIEADDTKSISIYTAGIPAEYGRKMGGVVELNTFDVQPGFHGESVLSGGSYNTAGAFAGGQYTWGRNTLGGSANGNMTSHYLNPVVPQNYSNIGTLGDFSGDYELNLTERDRFRLMVRHELARYDIPNELVQQEPQLLAELGQPAPPPGTPPQRQTADNFETLGEATYRHIFSPALLIDLRNMARDNSSDFKSNQSSWPILVSQHNDFKEEYFKGSLAVVKGSHELKAGVETDNIFLHENYSDAITANSTYPGYPFDPGTANAFSFSGSRPDLEQAAFVEDSLHFHNWTVNAGLRWDHYQLLVNQDAASPRLSVARHCPSANLLLHASYDRVFQTPSFENILLSSSGQVQSFEPTVLRLPVGPSHGNYYEIGATKGFFSQFRIDANMFRRDVNNYADDDQIQNTGISFPIAFRKGVIYGAEGKLDLPDWHGVSGFVSYAYEVGNAWFPVTGGLFLGQDALKATTQLSGHFPDSQDQRNTVRGRFRYQVKPRLWVAGGAEYDSGLPFDFNGTEQEALAEYGRPILNRINFERGRIDPSLLANASAGADVYKSDRVRIEFQIDGENLNDTLDVLDFGGLFSGNAIGPGRSLALRLRTSF